MRFSSYLSVNFCLKKNNTKTQSADHELSQQLDFSKTRNDMEFVFNNVRFRGVVIVLVWGPIMRALCYFNEKPSGRPAELGRG